MGNSTADDSRSDLPNGGAISGSLGIHLKSVLGVATVEATNRGSSLIEAEHLLLGFLFDRNAVGTKILAERGLTYAAFDEALAREREQTLAAIGVTLPDPERLRAAPRVRSGRLRLGASTKDAWQRAAETRKLRRSRGQRWGDLDFLIALLRAELGTIPRALARAGFDRQELITDLEAGL